MESLTAHEEAAINIAKVIQLDRENSSTIAGIERYRAEVKSAEESGRAASLAPNVKLMKQLIEPAAEAIEREVIGSFSGNNRSLKKARVLEALGTREAAYITLQHIMSSIGEKSAKVASALGRDIEVNCHISIAMQIEKVGNDEKMLGPALKSLLKNKYKGAGKAYAANGLDRTRRAILNAPSKSAIKAGESDKEITLADGTPVHFAMSTEEIASIGDALLNCVIAVTDGYGHSESGECGLFEFHYAREFNEKTRSVEVTKMIAATPFYIEYLNKWHSALEVVRPLFEPMLIKPLDWTGPYAGGYLTKRLPAVKGVPSLFVRDLHESEKLGSIYEALNALQATPWRYNERVFNVMQQLWSEKTVLRAKGWPDQNERAKPAYPQGYTKETIRLCKDADPEAFKAYKKAASEVEKFNHSLTRLNDIQQMQTRLSTVRTHLERTKNMDFYQVWQADFRGRLYPVPAVLTSQGSDFEKSLFEFARGKKMSLSGERWLKIHLANTWANNGLDKAPLDERVQWVDDNEQQIHEWGKNPLDNRGWLEADGGKKPWCFLAACIAYADFLEQGLDYECHLPVGVDGSNNGLQHFAAMTRSRADGSLVNLVPVDRPADIYKVVAERTNEILSEISNGDSDAVEVEEEDGKKLKLKDQEFAKRTSGSITRDIAKTPTMTYSYGVTAMGILGQVKKKGAHLFEHFKEAGDRDGARRASKFLAGCVYRGITTTVKDAHGAMTYLKELAKLVCSNDVPVIWSLPDGFEVRQDYRKMSTRRVFTVLSGAVRIKKDKITVLQEFIRSMKGFTIAEGEKLLRTEEMSSKDARGLAKRVKDFIDETGVLRLYRTEVDALIEAWTPSFDYPAYALSRYAKVGYQPVPDLEAGVETAIKTVIDAAFAEFAVIEESDGAEADLDGSEEEEGAGAGKTQTSVTISEPTSELDVNAQLRGVSPNFVHSIDAYHARSVVRECISSGITDLMMIHDSFGCHPSDVDALLEHTKETFIQIHSEPLLERFGEDLVKLHYVSAEEVAKTFERNLSYGDLDINEVRASDYFFA